MNPYDSASIKATLRDIRRHEGHTFFLMFGSTMLAILSVMFVGMAVLPPWSPDLFIPVLPMQIVAAFLYSRSRRSAAAARLLDLELTSAMRKSWDVRGSVKW